MRRSESRPGRAGRAQMARNSAGMPTVTRARTVLWRGETGTASPSSAAPKMTMAMYIARDRNRYRLSCMPLMIRWPSTTASGSAANESSSSTMSAAARVAWLPLCIEMPSCAWRSDSTSLTPSPIIATQ